MKIIYFVFLISFYGSFFAQNHHEKINQLLENNQYKNAITYIENNGLLGKSNFRYLYWDAKLKTDLDFDGYKLMMELFKKDTSNSEYYLTKYSVNFENADWEDVSASYSNAYSLDIHIGIVRENDPYRAQMKLLYARYLFELNLFSNVIKRFKSALKEDPLIKDANLYIAYVYGILSKSSKAYKYIEIEKNPKEQSSADPA